MGQELSRAMEFVLKRAECEMEALGVEDISPEHIFLGLLKLAEVTAESAMPNSRYAKQTNEEIKQVSDLLRDMEINPGKGRLKLRNALSIEKDSIEGFRAVERLLHKARQYSEDNMTTAINVLSILLYEPTPILKNTFDLGRFFLVLLTKRIRSLRESLLRQVYGQNHVVHAFAEGIFNSEVLAATGREQNRPRGIFVFAGPPGVGKTFLAEQGSRTLNIPYKRFDMSSFSDHQAHLGLIGFKHTGQVGQLTGFVKQNPHCILFFDEVEKAHLNTIQLFLQILDAGSLQDDFLDNKVSFKDTIIIFTTNAGKQLYEGEYRLNTAGLPRQTILNALETDINPQTNKPFFPAAICSRLATGYLMMFNHLQVYDLEQVSVGEFKRFADLFKKQYKIEITEDGLLAPILIFAEGGQTDARALRAQTEQFLKKEIFELYRHWEDRAVTNLKKLEKIRFEVAKDPIHPEVKTLFENPETPEILFLGNILSAGVLKAKSDGVIIHHEQDDNEALKIIENRNISFVLLELLVEKEYDEGTIGLSGPVIITANALKTCRRFLKKLHDNLPEMPVYLLGKDQLIIEKELLASFIRAGVRDKLIWPEDSFCSFNEQIQHICSRVYLQDMATKMAAQHKVLSFETAPKLSDDKKEITIRIRELSLHRALAAGDTREVLDQVIKPKVRFNDVFGAEEAKEELRFFLELLMKPQKNLISGIRLPKGVLLYGPPGTGKTLLAKAMAGESDAAFIHVTASSFVTQYQGSGPEAIRALFKRARRYAPAIIFIDEIDAIGRTRGNYGSAHAEEMTLNALLSEMDGFSTDIKRPVFVLAATNFNVAESNDSVNVLDPALIRRFDRKILVGLPNKRNRFDYLKSKLQVNDQVTDHMLERLSERSFGFTIADLDMVMKKGWIIASNNEKPLDDDQLEEAFELISHGAKKDVEMEHTERVAWHEAGHAYMAYLAGSSPSYLTVVARNNHGGYTEENREETIFTLKTKDELLKRVRIFLAGRAAEMVYYGSKEGLSTGCSDDLQKANHLVRMMICSYGMDEESGLIILTKKEATQGPLAEKIAGRISIILQDELEQTIQIIKKAQPAITRLVNRLKEKNKLDRDEIEEILKYR